MRGHMGHNSGVGGACKKRSGVEKGRCGAVCRWRVEWDAKHIGHGGQVKKNWKCTDCEIKVCRQVGDGKNGRQV